MIPPIASAHWAATHLQPIDFWWGINPWDRAFDVRLACSSQLRPTQPTRYLRIKSGAMAVTSKLRQSCVSGLRSRHLGALESNIKAIHSSAVFFFQAEDGIRDHCVTGVQTCALPI